MKKRQNSSHTLFNLKRVFWYYYKAEYLSIFGALFQIVPIVTKGNVIDTIEIKRKSRFTVAFGSNHKEEGEEQC